MNSLEAAIKHCEEALDMIKVLKQPCEDMRDITEEQRKSIKDYYIDSISKSTGVQFDDVYEELDFVQSHKKLAVNLQLCEDAISRESVIEWLKDKDIIKTKNQEENARRELVELPSVQLQPKKGRWIDIGYSLSKCSCCKLETKSPRYYCPNCGADMRGEKNEDG